MSRPCPHAEAAKRAADQVVDAELDALPDAHSAWGAWVWRMHVNRAVIRGRPSRLAALGLGPLLLASCNSSQSVTNPATPQARDIDTLWWAMFAGGMVVFAAVLVLLV